MVPCPQSPPPKFPAMRSSKCMRSKSSSSLATLLVSGVSSSSSPGQTSLAISPGRGNRRHTRNGTLNGDDDEIQHGGMFDQSDQFGQLDLFGSPSMLLDPQAPPQPAAPPPRIHSESAAVPGAGQSRFAPVIFLTSGWATTDIKGGWVKNLSKPISLLQLDQLNYPSTLLGGHSWMGFCQQEFGEFPPACLGSR